MTDDVVLISTHDLARAGPLREAFGRAGYATDLVTPDETLDAGGTVLLVLTGGVEDGGGSLARQARDRLRIPVFAVAPGEVTPALRPGFDELFAPSTSAEDIAAVGRTAIERRRLQRLTGIVGETDAIREALERVVQIAPVAATVLVTGESGTGKELVARGIHALSPRRHKPFIAVNVAALSETLLESELFGHEKGAFTGAIDARRGLFELAEGGTIFLDEIGEMPLATQTKLLRVLEQREFHRVGGEKTLRVDVRIVAATNQDLRQLMAIGEFRRDLYFRLNVLHIDLPALRERRDDIPLLVNAFVQDASERHDRAFPGISPEALEILKDYAWPGNVRELRNLVESMVVLAPNRPIQPGDIPSEVRGGKGRTLLPAPMTRPSALPTGGRDLRPELEFIFRTLVDLRVDMDDLRRQFEAYRRETALVPVDGGFHPREIAARGVSVGAYTPDSVVDEEPTVHEVVEQPPHEHGAPSPEPEGTVVFRPGMTMEDMEREAIRAALRAVGGNRRRAAEMLGIGERTLYRKIAGYGLDV
ncbi:MAG: sigma-54 dependent transcriptional regulator [Gemmatimonadetes bacterium]|nr:sigma-54 dependent transcriptional regulator [Gemmatimonadota bacterium]